MNRAIGLLIVFVFCIIALFAETEGYPSVANYLKTKTYQVDDATYASDCGRFCREFSGVVKVVANYAGDIELDDDLLAGFRGEKNVFGDWLYIPGESGNGIYVLGIAFFSNDDHLPMLLGIWNESDDKITYTDKFFASTLDDMRYFDEPQLFYQSMNELINIFGSIESRYQESSLSTEAQSAISALRKAYDVYLQTEGTTKGYTVDMAIKETGLGENSLRRWKFEVEGQPPRIYRAISTAEMPGGAGKKVWYDVDEARFHGYGVDE
jgi:hypothetical protein